MIRLFIEDILVYEVDSFHFSLFYLPSLSSIVISNSALYFQDSFELQGIIIFC